MKRNLQIASTAIIGSIKVILFIFTLIILLPVSCKKDKNSKEEIIEPLPKNSISFDKTSVTPGDVVTLTSEVTLNRDSWEIKTGSKVISLVKVDDNTAVFIVPYVPSGVLNLDLSLLGVSEKKPLTIANYVPVLDPEQIKNDYLLNLDQAISDNSTTEYANTLAVLKETFKVKYAALTLAEKTEAAFFLQKLNFNLPDTAGQTFSKVPYTKDFIEVPGSIESDQEYLQGGIAYMALLVKAGAILVASTEACAAPTGITQVIGVGGLGYATYCFSRAIAYKRILFFYNARHITLVDLIKPSSGDMFGAKSPGQTIYDSPEFVFKKDQQLAFKVSSSYQGVSIADENGGNVFFRNIVVITNRVTSAYNRAAGIVNKLKSWFSSDPKMIELESGIPAVPSVAVRYSPANLIKIENISESGITMTTVAEGQVLKITAKSNTITDNRTFTFDLVYNFPGIGINNRKKMTATFEGDPCMGVTDVPVINSTEITCGGQVLINFTSKEAPVSSARLYWRNASYGFPNWDHATNGYSSAGLKSGDMYNGVYVLSVYGIGCNTGQTPLQGWKHFSLNNEWKVELINSCGKVSASYQLY